jgi:hypothetical protein
VHPAIPGLHRIGIFTAQMDAIGAHATSVFLSWYCTTRAPQEIHADSRSASAAAEEALLVIAYSPRIGHMKSRPVIEPRLPSIQYPRNRPNSAAQRSAHPH